MTKTLAPLDVTCPFCGAGVGMSCYSRDGFRQLPGRISHVARRKEARREARAELDAVLEAMELSDYGPRYAHGQLSIENVAEIAAMDHQSCEVGVQVSHDGRVWLCVNGVAWIRFKPSG